MPRAEETKSVSECGKDNDGLLRKLMGLDYLRRSAKSSSCYSRQTFMFPQKNMFPVREGLGVAEERFKRKQNNNNNKRKPRVA